MYKQIAANKRKTVLMMVLFVGLVAGLGWLFGQYSGSPMITPYVLIGAAVYALISYYAGSRMSLALNGAHQIAKKDNPRLWRIVENLSITTGMPMPKVYIINDPAPNAMATGRDPRRATVAATTGLLDIMDDSELEGVMAHEMGHVQNYDIRVSMIAFALVAVISIIADIMLRMTWFRGRDSSNNSGSFVMVVGIAGAILAPIVATMIQLSISRKREYLADATGALTTRHPDGLARALEKIGQHGGGKLKRENASTAHLFFANPLRGKSMSTLFSTHPPLADRVRQLRGMGSGK